MRRWVSTGKYVLGLCCILSFVFTKFGGPGGGPPGRWTAAPAASTLSMLPTANHRAALLRRCPCCHRRRAARGRRPTRATTRRGGSKRTEGGVLFFLDFLLFFTPVCLGAGVRGNRGGVLVLVPDGRRVGRCWWWARPAPDARVRSPPAWLGLRVGGSLGPRVPDLGRMRRS